MEGQDLWRENQSLVMGVAKLIYGLTILLNPIFGLFGDQVVKLSHGAGRRLFVCSSACMARVGILTCLLSAKSHNFSMFIAGIFLWRLGEALNDVTTEAPMLVDVKAVAHADCRPDAVVEMWELWSRV